MRRPVWPSAVSMVDASGSERVRPLVVGFVALVLSACAPNGESTPTPDDIGAAVDSRIIVDGLSGPTQFARADDGDLVVAEINGGENDRQGRIVRIDAVPDREGAPAVETEVLLEGLDKPTGVAIFNDELWVMERNRLSRGPLDGDVAGADRVVVADDLPNNGRSEGALTVDGELLLFDTSGSVRDGEVVPRSGILWAADADGEVSAVAAGFKHAYAQTRTSAGQLVTTEIADGAYDGEVPPDELIVVEPGAQHGWPRCVGDNRAVAQYGGTPELCSAVPESLALFRSGATPTSVVSAPWDDDLLLVALWNEGRVVAISLSGTDVDAVEVFDGAQHPQHLVIDGDRVLVSDHTSGTITELTAAGWRPVGSDDQ